MFRPSVDQVIKVMEDKGYKVYDTPEIDWNLNIVGIRSLDPTPGVFNDTLCIFHKFCGIWEIYYYHITTDPSISYLKRPINSQGTAILKESQYRGAYKLDIHNRGRRGGHLALCQRLGEVTVYRDDNRDDKLNLVASSTQTGKFGINIHHTTDEYIEKQKFSAGCQVFADQRQFDDFILKCKAGRKAFGNQFTYTLLHQRDFT